MAVATQENPLVEGLERLPIHPTTMVIFGGTGDLAHRKLLPAIYNLAHEGALPERFNLIGVSRSDVPDDDYRQMMREAIQTYSRRKPDEQVLDKMLETVRYVPGTFDDDTMYQRLDQTLQGFDQEAGIEFNRLFYLSTAPAFFGTIVDKLGEHRLKSHDNAEVRVVIEKPFGTRLDEALDLNRRVLSVLDESQVFRIDHYLGKETVQNVLAFRFANGMFEPIWNRNYIDYVQITAAEDVGVGSRAGYYDTSGALRDLVENHMMQLLALLCMEPPVDFTADEVRDEKVKVLHAIKPVDPSCTVRARYTAGMAEGKEVPAYLDEQDVPADSQTETYAALRLEVDNWRWAGVPIYMRTGKRLARKVTEIVIVLKPVPHLAFESAGSVGVQPNQLVLTVQPNEGVSLSLAAKIPGTRMRIRPVNMEFLYGTAFLSQSPEAYERLILDAMRGDATLFTRDDEVEAQWRIIDPILESWAQGVPPLVEYQAGTAGPAEANELLEPGNKWRAV
jgi:glucose-6-phosphate 1-dehydrogenase